MALNDPKIPREEVKRLADLACLEIEESRLDLYAEQLGRIVDYVAKLRALDDEAPPNTDSPAGPDPAKDPFGLELDDLRDDLVQPGLTPDEALRCAGDRNKNFLRAPRAH